MHAYSTDESRVRTYAVIAIVAVIFSLAIVWLTSEFSWPQWLVSSPSMAVTYVFIYRLFDRVLWKVSFFRTVGLVAINDVSGTYQGTLISTFNNPDGTAVTRDLTLVVQQTWTNLEVSMTVTSGSSTSRSCSAIAAISEQAVSTRLVYVYQNKVNPAVADADMGDHDGAADLLISADGSLNGRYFNSRPRAGTIEARRTLP